MKLIPVLFSTPMVQAILQDRKTMTRRIIKTDANSIFWNCIALNGYAGWTDEHGLPVKCKYSLGDILWVRETWKPKCFAGFQLDGHDYKADHVTWLQKNGQQFIKGSGCEQGEVWKPSLFMPKAACRIFLKVTDVRPERLQDISEEDAKAEGAPALITDGDCEHFWENSNGSYVGGFYKLWEKINGAESWTKNPWVWVVSFARIEEPENFIDTTLLPHRQNNLPTPPVRGAG